MLRIFINYHYSYNTPSGDISINKEYYSLDDSFYTKYPSTTTNYIYGEIIVIQIFK